MTKKLILGVIVALMTLTVREARAQCVSASACTVTGNGVQYDGYTHVVLGRCGAVSYCVQRQCADVWYNPQTNRCNICNQGPYSHGINPIINPEDSLACILFGDPPACGCAYPYSPLGPCA
jgi:hypothetical protein